MARQGHLAAAGAILLLGALLLGESWLPGKVLLPLLPDDFPEWRAGRDEADLVRHPHPNWTMSDVLHLLLPGLTVTREAFARGELPLWDASQALGLPHLHQVHYGVLYPPAWLPLLFGLHGLALLALTHLVVAGWGTLLYLRSLGRSASACLVGAIAFACSAWITARLQSFPVVGAAVWLPWILWGLERAAQEDDVAGRWRADAEQAHLARSIGRRRRVAAGAALALSFFAGFPQVTLWLLALAGVVELVRVSRGGRATLVRNAGALLLGVGLALPQLVPTAHFLLTESLRGAQTADVLVAESLEAPLLWHLITPDRYAAAHVPGWHPLALRDTRLAQRFPAASRPEVSMGVGVLGLLLAAIGLVWARSWQARTLGAVALAVFVVLLWPPALRLAARLVPLLAFGNPNRLLLLSTFALAVLAAHGVDLLRERRLAVTVTAWCVAVLLLLLASVARATLPSTSTPGVIEAWAGELAVIVGQPELDAAAVLAQLPHESFVAAAGAAARSSLIAILAAVAAVIVLRPRAEHSESGWTTRVRSTPVILPLLLAAELLASAFPLVRAAPEDAASRWPGRIGRLRPPEVAKEAHATWPAAWPPVRVARVGNEPSWLRPDFPVLFGLRDVQAYAPMPPRRVAELLEACVPGSIVSGSMLGGLPTAADLAHPVVDLLGVGAVLAPAGTAAPGFTETARLGDVAVLRNDEAFPPAFVIPRVEVVADPALRLARLAAGDLELSLTALVEEDCGLGSSPASRAVAVTEWSPGRMSLFVEPGPPGLLVVSETFHPGWRARSGEAELDVVAADHALLGVPLAGSEAAAIELRFDPSDVRWGSAGGALAALIALVLLLRGRGGRGVMPPRWAPGLLLLLFVAGCGESAPAPFDAPLIRLWKDIAPVVHEPARSVAPAGTRRAQGDWYRVVPRKDGQGGQVLRHLPLEAPAMPLELRLRDGWGRALVLPVRGGAGVTLQLGARVLGTPPPHEMVAAIAVELREPFDPQRSLGAEEIQQLLQPRRHRNHLVAGSLSPAGRQSLEVRFVTDPETTSLVVYLVAPFSAEPEALVVEEIGLVNEPPAAYADALPGLTTASLRLDREDRAGFVALPGSSFTWTLAPCATPRRLELALGALPRDAAIEGSLGFRVRIDEGPALLEQDVRAPASIEDPAWSEHVVLLPASAERSQRLVLEVDGEGEPPFGFVAHPTLTRARQQPAFDIVLISLDTLRPDRLGCYGGDPALSPHLDALAAGGLRFARAYSTTSYTLPSHASLMTGQWPAVHGALDVTDRLSPRRSPFLARLLADAGWQTAAFTGGGYVATDYGFFEGFDRYSQNDPVWAVDTVRGRQLVETVSWERGRVQIPLLRRYDAGRVEGWIASRDPGTPFFLFLHTYVVHNYAPDRSWLLRRGLLQDGETELPFNHQDRTRFNAGEEALHDAVYEQYMPYYDATIGMADAFVGQVVEALAAAGRLERTLLVVTSDHGEEFGEHGFFGHGHALYEACTRIPLIVRLPASLGRPPAVVEEPVSLVDLAPWILALAGVPPDPRMTSPAPFAPTRADPPARERLVLELETSMLAVRAVLEGAHKLHEWPAASRAELYDLATDPLEIADLAPGAAARVVELSGRIDALHAWAAARRPPGEDDAPQALDPTLAEQLEQLGY